MSTTSITDELETTVILKQENAISNEDFMQEDIAQKSETHIVANGSDTFLETSNEIIEDMKDTNIGSTSLRVQTTSNSLKSSNIAMKKNTKFRENHVEVVATNKSDEEKRGASRIKCFSPPLFESSDYVLRYKDPKSGKLFSRNSTTMETQRNHYSSSMDFMINHRNSYMCSREFNPNIKVPFVARNTVSVNSFKAQQKAEQSTTEKESNTLKSNSSVNSKYSWKKIHDRKPIVPAPDRLYINTYLNKNGENVAKPVKNQKVNFDGSISENQNPELKSGQFVEHVFNMNNHFINLYMRQRGRQKSNLVSINNKTPLTPNPFVALEKRVNADTSPNGQRSRRPLKFENPNMYRSHLKPISPSQLASHSISDTQTTITELPSKNPSSVNSYLSYLRERSIANMLITR